MKAQYYIQWKDNGAWETIDSFSSMNTAMTMLGEYAIAYNCGHFRIRHRGEIVYQD